AAAHVIGAAPVDELVPARSRYEHVAGAGAVERRPQPAKRVGVGTPRDHTIAALQLERLGRTLDVPGRPVCVALAGTRLEAKLPALRPHARVVLVAPGQ